MGFKGGKSKMGEKKKKCFFWTLTRQTNLQQRYLGTSLMTFQSRCLTASSYHPCQNLTSGLKYRMTELYNKKVLVNLEAGKTHNYSKKVVSHCAVRSCIEHYRSQHMNLLEKCFLMKIPFSLASLNEAEKCPTPVTALHISSLSLGKLFKVSYIGDVKICYESGHENLTANPMLKS